jgi:hypothetical protein
VGEGVREVSCAGGRISNLFGLRFRGCFYPPTLEEASVRELSVLDLPALGFPTRPIKGSRGMLMRFCRVSLVCDGYKIQGFARLRSLLSSCIAKVAAWCRS